MPGALVPPRAAYGWFLFKLRSMGDGSVLSDDRWCAVSACAARQLWMAAVLGARPVLSLNARTSPRRRRRAVPECSRRTGTGVALASRDEYRRAAGGARELVASAAGTARCTPSGSRGLGNVGSRSRCVPPPPSPPLMWAFSFAALQKQFGQPKTSVAGARRQQEPAHRGTTVAAPNFGQPKPARPPLAGQKPVSYTHLTLPTNREV